MSNLDRRKFISTTSVVAGGLLLPSGAFSLFSDRHNRKTENFLADISAIPNFCTHEHWGSLCSIGMAPEQNGFRCDTTAGAGPLTNTSIWDLILDPYEGGWLNAAGRNPNILAKENGSESFRDWWKKDPAKALTAFGELVNSSLMTGGFQCTRRGIRKLYNVEIGGFNLKSWQKADTSIAENYKNNFSWYQRAMQQANFSEIIRPVHPEFYVTEESPASRKQEFSFTRTVMRIDPLLDLWKPESTRRNALAAIAGTDPVDAQTWRLFIRKLFDIAAQNNAVGIKQLQAYRRSLSYLARTDSEVLFRGNLKEEEIVVFQDWVMHECCRQADERNWAHQVHVGTHNLASSSPLPLQRLAVMYPKMNIVMIHCWPFLNEAGFLAKTVSNMYIDTCWLPVLNPEFFREGLKTWLNYVPAHKIMLGHDSTHVEMATGSSLFTREILSEVLTGQQRSLNISDASMRRIAADMLQNNAVKLYGFGKETM